jgi:hypothetical protein
LKILVVIWISKTCKALHIDWLKIICVQVQIKGKCDNFRLELSKDNFVSGKNKQKESYTEI